MYCENCGTFANEGQMFCGNCGAPLAASQVPASGQTPDLTNPANADDAFKRAMADAAALVTASAAPVEEPAAAPAPEQAGQPYQASPYAAAQQSASPSPYAATASIPAAAGGATGTPVPPSAYQTGAASYYQQPAQQPYAQAASPYAQAPQPTAQMPQPQVAGGQGQPSGPSGKRVGLIIAIVAVVLIGIIALAFGLGGKGSGSGSSAASNASASATSTSTTSSTASSAASTSASKSSAAATTSSSTSSSTSASTSSSSKGSTAASSAASTTGSTSSSSKSSAAASKTTSQADYLDSTKNPTLLALFELTGSELIDLIEKSGYKYDEDSEAWWFDNDRCQFWLATATDDLSSSDVKKLQKGASGAKVYFYHTVTGYTSSVDVMLAQNVVVEDVIVSDERDLLFAVAYGPSMKRYIVGVTPSANDTGVYAIAVFTQEGVESGLFGSFFDQADWAQGSSIDEIWRDLTGYPVGGYASRQGS